MATVQTFRDLIAYQKARALAVAARDFSKTFPSEEKYELAPQLRRAASSIPLNIAEGFGIGTTAGTLRHLRIARGSLCEVAAAVDLATDYGYGGIPSDSLTEALQHTERVLQGLIRSMERTPDRTATAPH